MSRSGVQNDCQCPSILSWLTVPNRCFRVDVWRGAAEGRFQTFQVPRRAHQTILDVVTEIQRDQDATLVLSLRLPRRHVRLLRHGGERPPALDLPHPRQRGGRADGKLQLEPLRNFTVVKDLAVEMVAFFDKWRDAKGHFEPGDAAGRFPGGAAGDAERKAADAGIECIGCGVCHSACDVVTWNKDYLGPAPLNRAWTLVNDVRDARQRRPHRRGLRQRRLPRLPQPHELHRVLPARHFADLFDRRIEARDDLARAAGASA